MNDRRERPTDDPPELRRHDAEGRPLPVHGDAVVVAGAKYRIRGFGAYVSEQLVDDEPVFSINFDVAGDHFRPTYDGEFVIADLYVSPAGPTWARSKTVIKLPGSGRWRFDRAAGAWRPAEAE